MNKFHELDERAKLIFELAESVYSELNLALEDETLPISSRPMWRRFKGRVKEALMLSGWQEPRKPRPESIIQFGNSGFELPKRK